MFFDNFEHFQFFKPTEILHLMLTNCLSITHIVILQQYLIYIDIKYDCIGMYAQHIILYSQRLYIGPCKVTQSLSTVFQME